MNALNKITVTDIKVNVIKNFMVVKADADVFEVDNNWIVFQLCSPFPTDRYSWDLTKNHNSAPP